jgi:hypothetical protein
MKAVYETLKVFFLIPLLFQCGSVKAQVFSQDQLSKKISLNGKIHTSITLFVHFDKTIYTNNETVWFTGYLLKSNLDDISKHQVLSVALVRDIDSLIIKQDKYLISNGLSFGQMVLPDSLLTGSYHFQVTTNKVRNGKPEVSFIQPIIIKTNIDPAFNASIRLLQESEAAGKANQLLISVTTRDSRLLPQPAEVSYRYGNINKTGITNLSGDLVLNLKEQPDLVDQNVYVKIKYGGETSFLNYPVSAVAPTAKVNFYPEGGNLVAGIAGKVAWEATNERGAPLAVKAILYKNKKAIDTIETNSYGIGGFILRPEIGNEYTVQLQHTTFANSSFSLPAILQDGIGMNIEAGTPKDTLKISLLSTKMRKVIVRVHDYVETYFIEEYKLEKGERAIEIPLTNISKGLKEVTVFDSLGRPIAERLIFSHYENAKKINITTDQAVYTKRNKVTLKLRLSGIDTLGFVSIACVQRNRLSAALTNDIESYVYLKDQLNKLPIPLNDNGYEDRDYVDNVLLTKGWRRYSWPDILKLNDIDTLHNYDTVAVKIKVTNKSDKNLKKPVELILMQDKSPWIGTTDASGVLILNNNQLHIEYGKQLNLFIGGKGQKDYTMKVIDSFTELNQNYLKFLHPEHLSVPTPIRNNNEMTLKSNERAIRLKEVKITSRNDNSLNYLAGGVNGRSTQFYIVGCPYDVPNCPIPGHSPGEHIIPKVDYDMYLRTGGRAFYGVVGSRDRKFSIRVPGIYTRKEFYINEFKDKLEPAFVSTLYWNHGSLLNNKEQEFIFYTGDIAGGFKVIVQGISDHNLLYGTFYFEVKNEK